jgi:hypothetical protein
MWRKPPPLLWFFFAFVGLGPPVGGALAYVLMSDEAGPGPDHVSDIVQIMLWGAYLAGFLPALLTGALAAYVWRRGFGPLSYVATCCALGAVSAPLIAALMLGPEGTASSDELIRLGVALAACGGAAGFLPALATLPARAPA